jgi:NDP-sugar pyrophosphorylase family protein
LLRGVSFDQPCSSIATAEPTVVREGVSVAEALQVMNSRDINQLPVLDAYDVLTGLLLRRDLTTEDWVPVSAVIMAGGFGTRLRPLTDQVPKPMLPVGDRPLLELTIDRLREAGIRRVNVTTHYLASEITNYFGDGREFGVDLIYVPEDRPLGTAGGLKLMEQTDQPLLVINGDILTGMNFRDLISFHRKNGADMTVGVRKYEVRVPYGVVETDGPFVRELREKPQLSFLINAGMYLLEPGVRRFIPDGQRFDMTELMQRLLKEGRRVASFPILEYWLDVGQPADYAQAQRDVETARIR